MTRTIHVFALAVCLLFAVPKPAAAAVIIAQAGFNDAVGINSNSTPNSPYPLGGNVSGTGAGEPGWAGPWVDGGTIQSTTVYEGDGALQITPTADPAREWTAQMMGQLTIEQYVRFTEGARLVAYTAQGLPEATTQQGPIWQAFPDHHFNVINGVGDGGSPTPIVTNFTWVPDVWYKVTVHTDVATKTWDFAVNDVPYLSPIPLGYRGTPTAITAVRYLSEGSGLVFVDAITVTPEPTSFVMAAMAISALLLVSRRLS